MADIAKKTLTKTPAKNGRKARRVPLKLRKLRGYRELVPDPFNLGI